MHDDNFELHVLENGRWSMVESFRGSERETAINEAKAAFNRPSVEAVRVVRETFDPTEEVYKQRTVFRNAKPKAPGERAAPRRSPPAPPPPPPKRVEKPKPPSKSTAAAPPPPRPRPPPQPSTPMFSPRVKRMAVASGTGLGIGGGSSYLFLDQAGTQLIGSGMTQATVQALSIGLFAAAFGLSLYLFTRAPKRSPSARAEMSSVPALAMSGGPGAAGLSGGGGQTEALAAALGPRPASSGEPAAAGAALMAGFEPGEPPPAAPAEATAQPQPPAQAQKAEKADPKKAEPKKAEAAPEGPADQNLIGRDRETVVRFFKECLTHASARQFVGSGRLSGHDKFGCHLFLLGAADAAMGVSGNGPSQLASVIETALGLLGSDAGKVRHFVSRQQEYRDDPKFRGMIQAGRDEMASFVSGRGDTGKGFGAALKAWNAGTGSEAGGAAAQDIAIMFTDMVSSVQTTQALGDEGAMKLVQAHNLIVGAVLKQHRGHQVKHTGDGVMAVFPRVVDGAAAAREIQRQIAEYNRVTPTHPLTVRIGVSAGQPIKEQDDYFGTVVQLSARLCAAAGSHEIAVSDKVAELVQGQFPLTDRRQVNLKGFQQTQTIYTLAWGGMEMAR